ncbi:hypothetical protein [Pseudalkalibacillus sp. SCS-8]|uniref:hypothetical protein n=1 Tax=Pseudalkalibacillus nanhaiensis TaxID=3115291 RepID=UPI0032DB6290
MSVERLVMGASYSTPVKIEEAGSNVRLHDVDINQKYFRPSCYPALNTKIQKYSFFNPYLKLEPEEIELPYALTATPDDTIIYYFSVLREAANFSGEKMGGCGTVGSARIPYPVAYSFFTDSYQKKVDYEAFYDSFQGIGHINLIKMTQTTRDPDHPGELRYFIEIETIEGTIQGNTTFAYYYGFMFLKKEKARYKIADFKLQGEDFLCAPYHGWNHDAEAAVQVMYGNWCKLIHKLYPIVQHGYVKQIDFKGTDGYLYRILFAELTNGYDIEIAQFRKQRNEPWQPITFNPEKCVKD